MIVLNIHKARPKIEWKFHTSANFISADYFTLQKFETISFKPKRTLPKKRLLYLVMLPILKFMAPHERERRNQTRCAMLPTLL